ncbi:MAG: UDP-N-acetylmuramate--L-alanine ligase [Crocinitomicaceae bacterium]|nr:UDP-N-acetylmuramate--L-alanine ligase [Crocinitomicaceae bacterium]
MNKESNQVNLNYTNYYFIGIGGIGMSSLARYFLSQKKKIAGYDKTSSTITESLQKEGVLIHFKEEVDQIPNDFLNPKRTLVIYTPAIPPMHKELLYFQDNFYQIYKRAEVLGLITFESKALCVAGTHGKTTSSTLLAHLLNESAWGCNAFLGGISTNYGSNFLLSSKSEYTVIEADEYDRSFLHLSPFASIVTSVDPDHLDIYEEEDAFISSFQEYVKLINPLGVCVINHGVNLDVNCSKITYSIQNQNADYSATEIKIKDSAFYMIIKTPEGQFHTVKLGLPGIHNAENALACFALLKELGMPVNKLLRGLESFMGVKRRFEFIIKSKKLIYIDDYAHHPSELNALIDSVKLLYPNKKISLIFQPHLFSRTRDFMNEFVEQLNQVDELILMPIYPAREEPIEGVSSDALLSKISLKSKHLLTPFEVLDFFSLKTRDIVVTAGAGDIDRLVSKLKNVLLKK